MRERKKERMKGKIYKNLTKPQIYKQKQTKFNDTKQKPKICTNKYNNAY